jgi:short-subunit dehydrogenase
MNKLIVVTGGTKGIGRAVVEKFASEGFDIVTCSRTRADLEELKRELEKVLSVHVFAFQADMSVREDVRSFCSYIAGLHRPVEVLVNNAGYFLPGELSTEPDGTLESMINANLYSAYYTTRGVVEGMKAKRHGHIFNVCSIASIKAYPNGGSYAVSKFAMLGFSKCLREELKPHNIRVTAVMPGATLTASWDGVELPEKRFMPVEDVAETIYSAYSLSARTVIEEIILRPQLGDI